MALLSVADNWPGPHAGAVVGVMALRDVAAPKSSPALEEAREQLESSLRTQFASREAIEQSPHMQAYKNYYKGFKKTYHVQGQLESVALKGKSIPNFNPIVEAMFMAELKNQLLTAGHDLDLVEAPLTLMISSGDENYTLINGQSQTLKPDDMFVRDAQGILSNIIYGPDQRTKIGRNSCNLFFVVYGVPGIDESAIRAHLQDIQANIARFSEGLSPGEIQIATAS